MLRDQLADVLHAIRYGDSRDAERMLLEMMQAEAARKALRNARDKLVLDYAAARGITARDARARLKVERPEFQWQEK